MRDTDQQMLVDHYLDFYRMAYSLLQDQKDVEDVVQEALARTMARPIVHNPLGYCVKVLYNECGRVMKRRSRIVVQSVSSNLASEEPMDIETHEKRLTQLRKERDNLPKKYQDILELYVDKGMSMAEISDRTGIPLTYVRKMINVAYTYLRKRMIPSIAKKI